MEKWKPIKGLPIGYEVSSLGNARINYGDHVEPIKIHLTSDKCSAIYVCGRMLKLHRIVAQAFIDNPENKPIVQHVDGDGTNNAVSNLMWVTRRESQLSKWRKHETSGKGVRCIETGIIYSTLTSAEIHLGIPRCAIEYSANNHTICFGYHFEYVTLEYVTDTTSANKLIFISSSDAIIYSEKFKSIDEFRNSYNK